MKALAAAAFLAASLAPYSRATLPPQASIGDLIASPSGVLYASGSSPTGYFIAQLPDGFTYTSPFPVTAIALGPTSSIYAAGTLYDPVAGYHAIVFKLNSAAQLQWLHPIDGPSTSASAIAVNTAGEALISGSISVSVAASAVFPTTPNAVAPTFNVTADQTAGFLVKLDPTGQRQIVAIRGFGRGPVAFDAAGNIYATGQVDWFTDILPTPGALQSAHARITCSGNKAFGIPCLYGYAAKISPDGTALLYSTYLTGDFGSNPTSLFVDSTGAALIAGTTYSHNFPVTPGAFQTENRANDTPVLDPNILFTTHPPPTAGFISQLAPDGTALTYSTYFSGTGHESITDAKLDGNGNIYLAGLTASSDLPGAVKPPRGCAPTVSQSQPFIAELTPDATDLVASRYINFLPLTAPKLILQPDGVPVLGAGDLVEPVALQEPIPAACIVDSADFLPVSHVSPSQLVTVLTALGASQPPVQFDGISAPILYSGSDQINAQVPTVIQTPTTTVTVDTPDGHISRTLPVAPVSPSAFVGIRNGDGSLNSLINPAPARSLVTLYLNGVGVGNPQVSLADPSVGTVISSAQDPGSPEGVWRVQIAVAPRTNATLPNNNLQILVNGIPLREQNLQVFVAP